ncbi:hypothetical protein D7231_34460 [Streptomyces klenkii]|uniref:Uncharacterized protein n=1 Tax=Streptomyces klenkii TaxID=1420899 RepID=A0A3B0ABS1_9ACTN|nr:hypothetical protein [Streptomyces klenkii]RKN56957.1 hypothetical protein D7231_34460 [Streptomyces klenkii]
MRGAAGGGGGDGAGGGAARLIHEAYQPPAPASYRDASPLPRYGPTPPVPQPDRRVVPTWATGTAVASLGGGAGLLGVSIGVRLILDGAAAMTMTGVAALSAPFIAIGAAALGIGAAASRARQPSQDTHITHVYESTVTQNTEINATSTTRGMFSRTRNDLRN